MTAKWNPKLGRIEPLVRPVPIDAAGLAGPTRGQSQGPCWRRSSRGFYVPASIDGIRPEQRVAEQAARLGPLGAVTGWGALRLHGAAYFDGELAEGARPVLLQSPDRHLRSDSASQCLLGALPTGDRTRRHGVAVTIAERALFDEMVRLELREAVVAMDMAAAAEVTSIRRMTERCERVPSLVGSIMVIPALALADERSRSPKESLLRLIWVIDAGLPRPLCNRPIFSIDGKLLGVPDLLDAEFGVVGEYDGADHQAADRRFRDLAREQVFRDHGLEYFTAVAADLHHVDETVERIRATFERARATTGSREKRWTLTPPPGWVPFPDETALDERLDFKDFLAEVSGT